MSLGMQYYTVSNWTRTKMSVESSAAVVNAQDR